MPFPKLALLITSVLLVLTFTNGLSGHFSDRIDNNAMLQFFEKINAYAEMKADSTSAPHSTKVGTVGDRPYNVAVNPDTNMVYVTNALSNELSVIDSLTNTVVATVELGSDQHYGVAVNPNTKMVYAAGSSSDTVSVIDSQTNTVVATLDTGDHPYGVAVNPDTNMVYVTNWYSDTVSVIDSVTNTIVATVQVGDRPWWVAVNPNTNMVYVTNADSKTVSVIDSQTNTVVATVVGLGDLPYGVAVNPSTNMVYVANTGSDTVSVIDSVTNTLVSTLGVGTFPWGVAVNPNTNMVYVTNAHSKTISVIDSLTNTVVATVEVEDLPYGVTVNPYTNIVYAALPSANAILMIDGSKISISPARMPFSVSSTLEGKTYTLTGKSLGVKVTSFTINPNESIIIELEGRGGEVELTLPNDMISEIHTIRSGGEEITFQKASNATATTVKFDLLSNTDSIEIIGTTVVPEFATISGLVLALSLLAIVGFIAVARGKGMKICSR